MVEPYQCNIAPCTCIFATFDGNNNSINVHQQVRMAERSKALRSGRSPLLWAWVRIPLLTTTFGAKEMNEGSYS